MQPSQYEIQREVEALRDIRRRSTTPGALAIDPDLPAQSSSSSSSPYWSGDHDPTSSNEDGSGTNSLTSDPNSPVTDDPFHLFWVPASVHPEIAPAEFRAFLKEHSRSPPPGDGPAPTRSSSLSAGSSGLGRKRSMLSRQYSPSENDGVGETEEKIVPLRRNRTGRFSNQGPQLTINDLQKLEELAEEASESNDPTKFRNILRRSLSLNVSPTAMEKLDAMPEMGDEADVPIIVPPPGQILRRAARTKIRKPGLPGDGGGHRFGATRKGATARAGTLPGTRTSSDRSSSDHGHTDSTESYPQRQRTLSVSDDFHSNRPDSFSEEGFIFDAYAHDGDDEYPPPTVITSAPPEPTLTAEPSSILQIPVHEVQPSLLEALGPVLELPPQEPEPPAPQSSPPQQPPVQPQPQIYQPQPERLLTPQAAVPEPPSPSRTPSPSSEGGQGTSPTPSFLSSPPSPQPSQPLRKEKDKKGLFGKWGSDKGSKKHKDHTRAESGDKEKESGFFGSLFGGKKNKDSDSGPPVAVQSGAAGREAAQALLGASKSSKNYQPPPSPGAAAINNYSRYPIHVERAIYRLSHIKLANPRRPLYEQVLISNLMFWYLGVINKAQNPSSTPNGQAGVGAGGGQGAGQANGTQEKEQKEKEQREAEQREKERLEHEAHEKEQREREQEKKKRDVSPKRGSLTKGGAGGGARRAEIPVKGPQYEMQHREMQQEYGYGGGYNAQPQSQGAARGRGPSSPPPGTGPRSGSANSIPPRLVQPSENQASDHFYYSPDMTHQQSPPQQQRLPPGAMAPVDYSNWGASPQQRRSPPPGPHRRSKSPPQQEYGGTSGGRSPGRSLSATAVPSAPLANGKIRKGVSAHAVSPKGRARSPENGMGEEDMPLAVWQQQRRK